MIDIVSSFILMGLAAVLLAGYALRAVLVGAPSFSRVKQAGASILLGKRPLLAGYWAIGPVARGCVALGIGQNAVTWASLALGAGAGTAIALGHPGGGAILAGASFACDALDGMIARQTGTASDQGEVLDAAVDRYTELFFLGGIALYGRVDAVMVGLAFAATAGAFMVSYSSAKAEALSVEPPRGAMRRPERAFYLVLGAALTPFTEWAVRSWGLPEWCGRVPLTLALGLVATVGNLSAVARLRAIARSVGRQNSSEGCNAPDAVGRREQCKPRGNGRRAASEPLQTDAHAATGDTFR